MKKTILRITGFIFVLILVLAYINSVFSFKFADGISQFTQFYKQEENSIDVLILGTSHAFVNINNGTLYDEYGIASFNLGGSIQPMWNSYFSLKEALKTQRPELIVLEGFGTVLDFEYSDDSRIIKNTYGMKWSRDKVEAIKVSSPEERNTEFLLDYSQYHARYASLSKGDFFDGFGNQSVDYNYFGDSWKGQFLFDTACPIKIPDVSGIDYEIELFPKTEEYYRKTIELAQENHIPIVVIVVPWQISEHEQSRLNKAESIAREYHVPFLNCNLLLDEIGLDLNTDFHDPGHLSAKGSMVFSQYIGKYLKDNFQLSDRRGLEKYKSWQDCADYVNQYIHDSAIMTSSSLGELSQQLNQSRNWVMISADGSCNSSDENIRCFLEEQGIFDEGVKGAWLKKDGSLVWSGVEELNELYFQSKYRDFCIRHNGETNTNEFIIDGQSYRKVNNGINIVVYNTYTNLVMTIGIDKDTGYSILK